MARRTRFFTSLLLVLLSGIGASMAAKYTVNTSPEPGGRIYIDGQFKGVAPVTVDLKLKKNVTTVVRADKAGGVSFWPVHVTKGHKGSILVRLEADPAFAVTEESAIANRWQTVEVRHSVDAEGNVDEELVWQKIVSIVTDRFSDLEQLDRGSFYLRSAWRTSQFPYSVRRHRVVVKRGVSQGLSVKVQLESEIFPRNSPTVPVDPNKFEPDTRIFSADRETVEFIRDQI